MIAAVQTLTTGLERVPHVQHLLASPFGKLLWSYMDPVLHPNIHHAVNMLSAYAPNLDFTTSMQDTDDVYKTIVASEQCQDLQDLFGYNSLSRMTYDKCSHQGEPVFESSISYRLKFPENITCDLAEYIENDLNSRSEYINDAYCERCHESEQHAREMRARGGRKSSILQRSTSPLMVLRLFLRNPSARGIPHLNITPNRPIKLAYENGSDDHFLPVAFVFHLPNHWIVQKKLLNSNQWITCDDKHIRPLREDQVGNTPHGVLANILLEKILPLQTVGQSGDTAFPTNTERMADTPDSSDHHEKKVEDNLQQIENELKLLVNHVSQREEFGTSNQSFSDVIISLMDLLQNMDPIKIHTR
jgi:hypothetical protein